MTKVLPAAALSAFVLSAASFPVPARAGSPPLKGPAVSGRVDAGSPVLDNGLLSARYDPEARTLSFLRKGAPFLEGGALWGEAAAEGSEAHIIDIKDDLGDGKAILVRSPAGSAMVSLHPGLPFACIRTSIRNGGAGDRTCRNVAALSGRLEAGPIGDLRLLGCDGLGSVDTGESGKASWFFIAAARPSTGAGIVAGWLTHERGSGIAAVHGRDGKAVLEAWTEYGKLIVPEGKTAEGEILAVGAFDDAVEGLEGLGDAVARANRVRPRRTPDGYCTWYHAHALDEKRLGDLARFCRERKLVEHGLEFLQIDDGWQRVPPAAGGRRGSGRDFTSHNPKGPYPSGMAAAAAAVREAGLTAGLWLIPFGWDPKAPALAAHPDWFVHRQDGSIYEVHWAGKCLDMSHPEAREFLRGVVARATGEWGFRYLKIDGLWSGLAAKILYPSPAYSDDGLGDAVFRDPSKTNVEIYRDGLRLVREAAGKDAFILGCNIAQNMRTLGASFGLVDGMRVGADIGADWNAIVACVPMGARLFFLHGRVWSNDPDCLLVRKPLTLDQARAWASLIGLSGQMAVVSEWLPGLPEERLDVVKRVLPNHGLRGRPVDLFEADPPRVWHLRAGWGEARRDVVGLFRWRSSDPERVSVDLRKLGLETGGGARYLGFDFWGDRFLPPVEGELALELPAGSCKVVSLIRERGRPQILSTSAHVGQGITDVIAQGWHADRLLRGRSRVFGGEPYELRIATAGYTAVSAKVTRDDGGDAGTLPALKEEGGCLRVTLTAPASGEVNWDVTLERR